MTKTSDKEKKGQKLTKLELSVINQALQLDPGGRPRQFPIHELKQAMGVSDKILLCTECVMGDDGLLQDANGELVRVFVDGSVEFTSEENILIKKLINESQWDVQRGKVALDLLSKLP